MLFQAPGVEQPHIAEMPSVLILDALPSAHFSNRTATLRSFRMFRRHNSMSHVSTPWDIAYFKVLLVSVCLRHSRGRPIRIKETKTGSGARTMDSQGRICQC